MDFEAGISKNARLEGMKALADGTAEDVAITLALGSAPEKKIRAQFI